MNYGDIFDAEGYIEHAILMEVYSLLYLFILTKWRNM